MQRNTRKTTKEMQDELSAKFPNLRLVGEYKQANAKMLIHCDNCGYEWEAVPRSVVHSKHGCLKCGVRQSQIEKSFERFKQFIDLDQWEILEYKDTSDITLACKKCGWIRKTNANNIKKFGCKRCAALEATKNQRLTTEIFIQRAQKVHGNKYDYSKVNYINYHTPVEIICPTHGSFWQRPGKHLLGHNCPLCFESRGEEIIRLLLSKYNIPFEKEKQYFVYKTIFVDYYINYNQKEYIIEMNGKQHYEPIEYFGGEEAFLEQIKRDKALADMCNQNNIVLYNIKYNENIVQKTLEIIKQICAVPKEESLELLSGNIGKTLEIEDPEINSEIAKGSESSYSVETE